MILVLIVIAMVIFTFLGGLFALKLKDKLHLVLGFSAGAVLGVALFNLLPESIELTSGVYDVQVVAILAAVGFSIYMLVDRLFSIHQHDKDDCENPRHNGKLGALALLLHSYLDGFGIGLAFKISPAIGLVVAVAVLAHKFSDGINTISVLAKNKDGLKDAKKWLIANSVSPVVGVASSYFISVSESTLGLILSVFIGLFLYISASDLIPESHHHHPTIWTTISTIIGMLVIFIAVQFAR